MTKKATLSKTVAASGSTADTLLDTAEHLFARQGIENVSMRRLASECGHGNRSGALYHFGSREELIRRLLERRMEVVNAIRHQRLDELVAAGGHHDLRSIFACAVSVLAEIVRAYPWGSDYVLIIAQAMATPRIQVPNNLDANAVSGFTRTADMAQLLLPDLPQEKFRARMQMALHEAVHSFALWLYQNGEWSKARNESFQAMSETVVEFIAAGMAAPPTVSTAPGKGVSAPAKNGSRQSRTPATKATGVPARLT